MNYSGEDLLPNLSLNEKMASDFGLVFPSMEEGIDPETYFLKIAEIIDREKPEWKVRREVTLSLLNFSKLLMYLDLDPTRWAREGGLLNHPIAGQLLGNLDIEEDDDHSGGFEQELEIDRVDDVHNKYPLILDADSSQHSALIEAIRGKNLVIEGPPGTGKSQTIANLIAAALQNGKTVLFMAEKMAALSVVKQRLDDVGMGDFCLELHSNKAQKRRVLDDINARIKKKGRYPQPKDLDIQISRYEELRRRLSDHAVRVNSRFAASGKTIQQILSSAVRYRLEIGEVIDGLQISTIEPETYTQHFEASLVEQANTIKNALQEVLRRQQGEPKLAELPWFGVRKADAEAREISESLMAWQKSLDLVDRVCEDVAKQLNRPEGLGGTTLPQLEELLGELDVISKLPRAGVRWESLKALVGSGLAEAKSYLEESVQACSDTKSLEEFFDLSSIGETRSIVEKVLDLEGELRGELPVSELLSALELGQGLRSCGVELLEVETAIAEKYSSLLPEVFGFDERGLERFSRFVMLANQLPKEVYSLRSASFDDEEIDSVLEELESKQAALVARRRAVGECYDVEKLMSVAELGLYIQTIESAGWFRWLKPQWWRSRAQLLALKVSQSVTFKALADRGQEALSIRQDIDSFNADKLFQEKFGTNFVGLETNIASLKSIRSWYRSVRAEYGVGFGRKPAVGNALLALDGDFLKAVASLADNSGGLSVTQVLSEVATLKSAFKRHSQYARDNQDVHPDSSNLLVTSTSMAAALSRIAEIIRDDSVTFAELCRKLKALQNNLNDMERLTRSEVDPALFGGAIGIRFEYGVSNERQLEVLSNSVGLAEKLRAIGNAELRAVFETISSEGQFSDSLKTLRKLKVVFDNQCEKRGLFEEASNVDFALWLQGEWSTVRIKARNDLALQNSDSLALWLEYLRIRMTSAAGGFESVLGLVESGVLELDLVVPAMQAAIYNQLATYILDKEPGLKRFSGIEQGSLQKQFAECDKTLAKLQRAKVAWKTSRKPVPVGRKSAKVSQLSELALLERECTKERAHRPIRELAKRAPGALQGLKPCFLMGPMSIAQYLPPNDLEFDLLVIDEASQIRPEDALGAIARSKQLVVVGDPKQMPPGRAFEKVAGEELEENKDDELALQDSESILDVALPLFAKRRLRWHYRSKHQSLIAFSNYSFYDDDLVVFPSPQGESDQYGVSYKRVSAGTFVNQQNIEEANQVALALKNQLMQHPEESVGVVAMSAKQQQAIEIAVEALAKSDRAFEAVLEARRSGTDSWFIKNLVDCFLFKLGRVTNPFAHFYLS
jgi:hypothetical protein